MSYHEQEQYFVQTVANLPLTNLEKALIFNAFFKVMAASDKERPCRHDIEAAEVAEREGVERG